MKKVITICLLVVSLLVGGMTMDAKTTKKSSKTSSSASWNGDIPSATILNKLFSKPFDNGYDGQLRNHGYTIREDRGNGCPIYKTWEKSGICKIEYGHGCEAGDEYLEIEVYNTSKSNTLYNEFKRLISNKKIKYVYVHKSGNTIYLNPDD